MKIDRRCFLSLGIGAAAGIGLTPLPWKLTDDLSIWTQNWPWTPVPEDGEASYVGSACTLCPGGCGITVRKIDDRAVKIEGTKEHPVNGGGICMLGLSGLQLLYGPTRVRTPLIKDDQGGFRKISWEDAIKEVVKKAGELRSSGQSDSIGAIAGLNRGTVSKLLERLLFASGSPNFIRTASMQDTYEIVLKMMHGIEANAGFDLENADYVLSFGAGILDGWGSPVRMFLANSALKEKKAKTVQIEPRQSNTAAKADRWVPVKPGSETALALGMINVIINQGLYDKAFIKKNSVGLKELKKLSDAFTPEKVAELAGGKAARISAETIVTLAKEFAGASKPIAVCGKGRGMTAGSLSEFMAVHALNALVGNIGKPGGVSAIPEPPYVNWPAIAMDEVSKKGVSKKRVDGAGSNKYPNTKSMVNRFTQFAGSLSLLFVAGANPCYSLPNAAAVKKAFHKDLFVVSFSSYMDETAQQADLILPNLGNLERYEDVYAPTGMTKPVVGVSKPVVQPECDSRNTGDVIIEIAKKLGGTIAESFPWDNYEACLNETLGGKLESVAEKGFVSDPKWAKPLSGKIDFRPLTSTVKTDDKPEENADPVLIPYDTIRLASDYLGDPPFMIKCVSDSVLKGDESFVEVNPNTAKKLGIGDGDKVTLSTSTGKAAVRVHCSNGLMPGVIAMPRGLGHEGDDKYLSGKGVNFNDLARPVEDRISGLDTACGIRVKIAKA